MKITKQYLNRMFLTAATVVSLLCIFCIGCGRTTETLESVAALPEQFSVTGGEPLPEKWWRSFNDSDLDALIEEAVDNNFTIRAAWDRLSQAELIAAQAGASLLPEVGYEADYSRTRREVSDQTTYTTAYSIGLAASYEVDLWGRVRSTQQAAILDAQSSQEDVFAAAITLSANIAKTWYQLAEAKLQETLIGKQLDTNRKVLEIISVQFRQGQAGASDVFRQRQLVESSRGQLIQIRESIVLLQNQLCVLIGKNPEQLWSDKSIELITLPQLPRTGLPAGVLQGRPDIKSAYKKIQSADQRVAAAIADRYPQISISASSETYGNSTKDLFDDWLANLAGNVAGPVFDAGYRKAELQRRRAILSERINDYAQTVLEAVQEVEDAVSQESHQREYIENLQRQLVLAQQVFDSTRQNYLKGQLDYIRVLESLVSQQTLERNELAARRVLVERRIDLCRSIAGNWPIERPERAQLQ